VEAGASTATAHLDRAEGEVTVLPDEPQPTSVSAIAITPAFTVNAGTRTAV
jgi:hypothetical protein